MPEIIKILIVEDTASDIQSYQDSIRTVNMEIAPHFKIEAIFKTSKEEGLAAIHELKDELNGAFIDLKLSPGTPTDVNEGNEIIDSIYGKLRFPVIVLTNTPGGFDPKFSKSSFLELLTKTDVQYNDVLKKLVEVHKTGITKILGGKGKIESMLNEIFWKHLSNPINIWSSDKSRTPEQKEKSLLRYTLSNIQEYLDLTETGNFEHYTPSEFYISPPVKQSLFTGDLIQYNNKRCIVLTPACDFGNKKADNILFVSIKNWESIDHEFSKRPISSGKETILKGLISNKTPRYHFIPKTNGIEAGFIDFQDKITLDYERTRLLIEKKKAVRFATVSAPFLKDIISRYSNYYSRQGSPDFRTEEIYGSLF